MNGKVTYQEKLLFTKHLATMIKAGIPLDEAIDSLTDDMKSKVFRSALERILQGVKEGNALSDCFKKERHIFDDFYINLISVAEASGTLDETLVFLTQQLNKDYISRKKIKSALVYPAVIVGMASALGIMVSFFVLPKLTDFFESLSVDLPITTKILIFIAYGMRDYGIYILAGIVLLFIFGFVMLKNKKIRLFVDSILIKMPVLGKMFMYSNLSRFARNFGVLIKSGTPINKSLEISANTITNMRYRTDLNRVYVNLNKGKKISLTLKEEGFDEFPSVFVKMIAVGEKTGKLDESLIYLSDFYEEEMDEIIRNFTTLIEPVLLVIVGLGVGFLAISIISPVYELTGSIRR
jgi:type IV pilus assembly protein PilC